MGLNCYAESAAIEGFHNIYREDLPSDVLQQFKDAGLQLCGRTEKGTSFRGKVYNAVFEAITGESLYGYLIPYTLGTIVLPRLQAFLLEHTQHAPDYDIDARTINPSITDPWEYYTMTLGELQDLTTFVRICVRNSLAIRGIF